MPPAVGGRPERDEHDARPNERNLPTGDFLETKDIFHSKGLGKLTGAPPKGDPPQERQLKSKIKRSLEDSEKQKMLKDKRK